MSHRQNATLEARDDPRLDRGGWPPMTILDVHGAFVSVRVAADLCEISVDRVLTLLSSKIVRPVQIQGRRFVSLLAVESAIREEDEHGHSL
jgi:hypothetical protein